MLEKTRHIKISDYDYPLPDERIAKFPLAQRDHSKLLLYKHGEVGEDVFCNLPTHLPKGALMVFNNTRVIQARMHFRKETGALIEIFLMEPAQPTDYELMFQTNARCSWLCMIGNLKKWKEGTLKRSFEINGNTLELTATVNRTKANTAAAGGTNHWVDFAWDNSKVSFAEILEAVGELPIPPYLNRNTQESDKQTYQTVYSKIKGSVAAPTAGVGSTRRGRHRPRRTHFARWRRHFQTRKKHRDRRAQHAHRIRGGASPHPRKPAFARLFCHRRGHNQRAHARKSLLYGREVGAQSAGCGRRTARLPMGTLRAGTQRRWARRREWHCRNCRTSIAKSACLLGQQRLVGSSFQHANHHCARL